MDLDDYAEPEVGVAVALTAAVMSPTVRRSLRKGVIYGLAGVLMAGDSVRDFGKGVKAGIKGATSPAAGTPKPEKAHG